MANYTGNYQNIAGRPSFFMSWTHFLWGNNFKYNNSVYPNYDTSSQFGDTENIIFDKLLDLDFNNQKTLLHTSDGGNEIRYNLCDSSQPDTFKLSSIPNGLVFDYVFVLNHNLKSAGAIMSFKDSLDVTGIVNEGFEHDGFSLFKINSTSSTSSVLTLLFDPSSSTYNENIKIGSIVFAKKFTMPVTPHVNHSLTFMPSGGAMSKSISGAKHYNNPNVYGRSNAFRVHDATDYKGLIKSGKRKYNIAFDMLLNSVTSPSLFPVNEAANVEPDSISPIEGAEEDSYIPDGFMDNTDDIYSDYGDGIPMEEEGTTWRSNSFVGRVWTLTNGFNQPLIFLPNNDYEAYPDQYSICRIKGDTFKADQVANGAYKMRLELEEQT